MSDFKAFNRCFPFDKRTVRALFWETHTVFVGDSLMRAIYKDLVCMVQERQPPFLSDRDLRERCEMTHMGDRQIDMEAYRGGGVFVQAREYQDKNILFQFHFTTRIFSPDLECMLARFTKEARYPDFLFISSCLWDVSRYHEMRQEENDNQDDKYGRHDQRIIMAEYEQRLALLFRRLRVAVPATTTITIVLMPHCQPIQERFYGAGGSYQASKDNKLVLRALMTKANYFAAQMARQEGFSVIDFDFYMRPPNLACLRVKDGIHWNPLGTRMQTQLLVAHMFRDHEIDLPADATQKIEAMQTAVKVPDSLEQKAMHIYNSADMSTLVGDQENPESKEIRHKLLVANPFYVNMQRALGGKVLEELPEEDKKAICDDIAIMRALLMVFKGCQLRDREDYEEMFKEVLAGQQALRIGEDPAVPAVPVPGEAGKKKKKQVLEVVQKPSRKRGRED